MKSQGDEENTTQRIGNSERKEDRKHIEEKRVHTGSE
jgi:hypothetical protein